VPDRSNPQTRPSFGQAQWIDPIISIFIVGSVLYESIPRFGMGMEIGAILHEYNFFPKKTDFEKRVFLIEKTRHVSEVAKYEP